MNFNLKSKYYLFLNIFLSIVTASLISFLSQKGFIKRIELTSLDFSFRLRSNTLPNPHIAIIEITDNDILQIGRWPWKRSLSANLIDALKDFGAKSIFLDFLLSEPAIEEDDETLETAIKIADNVYLPFAVDKNNIILPLERFSDYLKATVGSHTFPDIDGIIRKSPLLFSVNNNIYLSASLKLAMDYNQMSSISVGTTHITLAGPQKITRIPLIEKNTMLINWLGTWEKTFKHYSFTDILEAYQDANENKTPKINTHELKDSICLVGITAVGLYDIKSIPLQTLYPAIGITATILSNILNNDFIRVAPSGINTLILYLMCLLPAFLILGNKPLREILFIVLTAGTYFFIHLHLFKNNLLINLTTPLLGLFISYLIIETTNLLQAIKKQKQLFEVSITDGLTGLYNITYFKVLLGNEIMLANQDTGKKFCVVMCDIDHFKRFNDNYGHDTGDLVLKEIASALKTSLRSSDTIARYGGEEMIAVLRGCVLQEGLRLAERMRTNVENHLIKDKNNIHKITISVGVSYYQTEDNVDTIIKRADISLYQAKESGRNCVATIETTEN